MPPLVRDVALPLLLTLLLQTSAMPLLLLFSNRILQVVLVWSPLLLLPLVPVLLPPVYTCAGAAAAAFLLAMQIKDKKRNCWQKLSAKLRGHRGWKRRLCV